MASKRNPTTEKLIESLESYYLTPKEARLYVAALELGEASMADIALHAELKRSTAYKIAEELEEKGLLGHFTAQKKQRYVATRPENLVGLLEKNLTEIQDDLINLKKVFEEPKVKPKVQYYEGVEGYKAAIEDSLSTPNTTLRHIGSLGEIYKIIGPQYDLDYYIPKRVQRNINLKAIYYGDAPKDLTEKGNDLEELREIRYIPGDETNYRSTTLLFGDKVLITSGHENLMTLVIENPEIAAAKRHHFDLLWKDVAKK